MLGVLSSIVTGVKVPSFYLVTHTCTYSHNTHTVLSSYVTRKSVLVRCYTVILCMEKTQLVNDTERLLFIYLNDWLIDTSILFYLQIFLIVQTGVRNLWSLCISRYFLKRHLFEKRRFEKDKSKKISCNYSFLV